MLVEVASASLLKKMRTMTTDMKTPKTENGGTWRVSGMQTRRGHGRTSTATYPSTRELQAAPGSEAGIRTGFKETSRGPPALNSPSQHRPHSRRRRSAALRPPAAPAPAPPCRDQRLRRCSRRRLTLSPCPSHPPPPAPGRKGAGPVRRRVRRRRVPCPWRRRTEAAPKAAAVLGERR